MEASQHSLLAAYFTLHSINATLAIVPQRGAGLRIKSCEESFTPIGAFISLTSYNTGDELWEAAVRARRQQIDILQLFIDCFLNFLNL
jgi:hypothetical protein